MKAQVSIEFLILIFILVLVFTFFSSSTTSIKNQLNSIRIQTEARRLVNKIASEINLAVEVGDGYERRFYVENSFAGITDFSITISNYTISLEWKRGVVYSPLISSSIQGEIRKGWNVVRNVDGIIYVE